MPPLTPSFSKVGRTSLTLPAPCEVYHVCKSYRVRGYRVRCAPCSYFMFYAANLQSIRAQREKAWEFSGGEGCCPPCFSIYLSFHSAVIALEAPAPPIRRGAPRTQQPRGPPGRATSFEGGRARVLPGHETVLDQHAPEDVGTDFDNVLNSGAVYDGGDFAAHVSAAEDELGLSPGLAVDEASLAADAYPPPATGGPAAGINPLGGLRDWLQGNDAIGEEPSSADTTATDPPPSQQQHAMPRHRHPHAPPFHPAHLAHAHPVGENLRTDPSSIEEEAFPPGDPSAAVGPHRHPHDHMAPHPPAPGFPRAPGAQAPAPTGSDAASFEEEEEGGEWEDAEGGGEYYEDVSRWYCPPRLAWGADLGV